MSSAAALPVAARPIRVLPKAEGPCRRLRVRDDIDRDVRRNLLILCNLLHTQPRLETLDEVRPRLRAALLRSWR